MAGQQCQPVGGPLDKSIARMKRACKQCMTLERSNGELGRLLASMTAAVKGGSSSASDQHLPGVPCRLSDCHGYRP